MNKSASNRWVRRKEKLRNSLDKVLFNLAARKYSMGDHHQVIADAEAALFNKLLYESEEAYLASPDPLVRQGWRLKQEVEGHFSGLFSGSTKERVLIQVPVPDFSPAGYSLFTNLAESLAFMGVPTRILAWDEDTRQVIEAF